MHCLVSLVWTDIYRVMIREYCTLLSGMHNRAIFNDSSPYRDPALFSSPGQNIIEDKGLTGEETHVTFSLKFHKRN